MNPTSFAPIDIPAKKVVNFKPSIYLNHLLNVKKRGRKGKAKIISAYSILVIISLSISSALWS